MQKIYLLLRNNTQLGPFSIEELLEQEILPTDLVWVEGKSLAWSYASELNLLRLSRNSHAEGHKHASGTSHPSAHAAGSKRKHSRVRKGMVPPLHHPASEPLAQPLPSPMTSAFSPGDVERKAEELRQRALAAERTHHYKAPTPVQEVYTPALPDTEEGDIELIYHKRKSFHIPFPQILVGGMVTAMFIAGWYGKPLFRPRVDTVNSTATPLLHTEENTAQAPRSAKPQPVPVVTDSTATQDSLQPTTALYTGVAETRPKRTAEQAQLDQSAAQPEASNTEPPVVTTEKPKAEESQASDPVPIVVTAKKEPAPTDTAETVAEEGKERKKGFLRGIFKKKRDKNGSGSEEDSSNTQSSSNESKEQ